MGCIATILLFFKFFRAGKQGLDGKKKSFGELDFFQRPPRQPLKFSFGWALNL